ncbi:hypothetical protein [Melissococcus plutonius]|uniref:hypothetical protein n=1 Tax=Melissococcus plutonius TaxID=33970 RepID=UPI003C2C2663
MKKIVSAFLALMVIFSGFIVINLYQTKDQERLENIEQTSNSFKIYVSNTTQTPDKMLPFFQKLSDEKKISIIRTDFPKDKVLKSVIINQASFSFQNFFQKDNVHTIFHNKDVIYSSSKKNLRKTNQTIPTFVASPVIELQSLYNYFSNNDKSANGIYTIIPKSNKNKEVLLKEMSDFFGLTIKDLQTPKMHSKKDT